MGLLVSSTIVNLVMEKEDTKLFPVWTMFPITTKDTLMIASLHSINFVSLPYVEGTSKRIP